MAWDGREELIRTTAHQPSGVWFRGQAVVQTGPEGSVSFAFAAG